MPLSICSEIAASGSLVQRGRRGGCRTDCFIRTRRLTIDAVFTDYDPEDRRCFSSPLLAGRRHGISVPLIGDTWAFIIVDTALDCKVVDVRRLEIEFCHSLHLLGGLIEHQGTAFN